MNDWRLDSIGQHDDSPPLPPGSSTDDTASGEQGAKPGSRKGIRRGVAGLVVLVAVAGFGSALWYAYDTYRTQGGAGIAPLIRADLTPTRIKPEQPGGMDVPHRDRLVLQDPEGEPEADSDVAVVDTAEEPLPAPDEPSASQAAEAADKADGSEGLVEVAEASSDAAEAGDINDPIGDIIAGTAPKPDADSPRAVEPSKADAAAPADAAPVTEPVETADTAAQAQPQDQDDLQVAAAPAEAVEVAQLDEPQVVSDAATPQLPADTSGTPAASLGNTQTIAPPEGTEALIPRTIEVAQAETDGDQGDDPAEPTDRPGDQVQPLFDDDELPEISTTPLLTPTDEDRPSTGQPSGDTAPETARQATPSQDEASDDAAASPTATATDASEVEAQPDAEPEPQVIFALPLGALDAEAAADLRIAEAISPAGFDPGAALSALGASPSAVDETASAEDGTAPVTAEPAEEQPAEATETVAAPATDSPPQSTTVSGWRVQLAAVPSSEAAEEEWRRFRDRYPDLLGNLELMVPSVEIEGQRWYRIQAGPLDEAGAQRLCVQLKERGADCIVRN